MRSGAGGSWREHREAFDAAGPADGRGGRAAHGLHQAVVAAAGEDGALGAEMGGDEFEGGVAVIVEAADDAGVFGEGDFEGVEVAAKVVVMGLGGGCEGGVDGGGVGDKLAVVLVLAVEDAQRVADEAVAAFGAEAGGVGFEVGDEGGAVGGAGFGVAEGVDFEGDAVRDAEGVEHVVAEGDDFGVGERLGGADEFGADLVELAVATLLRALVAEHGAGVEDFLREALGEAVGDEGAADAGGAFRAKGDAVAAAVLEGVHFLGDDVGSVAEGAGEDAGFFEDGGGPFVEAVAAGEGARGVDDVGVAAPVFADEVARAADGLEGFRQLTPPPARR